MILYHDLLYPRNQKIYPLYLIQYALCCIYLSLFESPIILQTTILRQAYKLTISNLSYQIFLIIFHRYIRTSKANSFKKSSGTYVAHQHYFIVNLRIRYRNSHIFQFSFLIAAR